MPTDVTKAELIRLIIERLNNDLELFVNAAKTAHEAAIDEENQPDNKYDTTALEASYVAQGQANRAQELRRSIEIYKQLELSEKNEKIRIASLVTLGDQSGCQRKMFIGPTEGGLKISTESGDVTIITSLSPLGKNLIGKSVDDLIDISRGAAQICYHIVNVT